jgi:hypothetical protein
MKPNKYILGILLVCVVFITRAQTKKYTNSLLLSNGVDSLELLLQDNIPISFFKTGKMKSIENKCSRYALIVIAYNKGKDSYFVSNTFQWRDTLVKHIYKHKPDSLLIIRQFGSPDKMHNVSHHIRLEND